MAANLFFNLAPHRDRRVFRPASEAVLEVYGKL
jgi:hypothetical protein